LEFNAVTPYSVAATLIVFLGGIQSAIFGVIMPHAAQLHAHQDAAALGNLLLKATKLGVLLLLLTGLPLIVFSAPIIRTWIGSPFLPLGGRVLMVLVTANMIRLTGIPFASILIGTGQQRLVVLTPFVEGVTNFFFSIALGLKYGAIGVAWGTLIGAIAAALANIGYNLPRVRGSIQCSPLRYLFEAIVLPASCGIPVFLALPATILFKSVGSGITTPACLVSFCACAFVICRNSFKDFRTLASPLR
jgi:O-antigen/teichoic acid export membrane protein